MIRSEEIVPAGLDRMVSVEAVSDGETDFFIPDTLSER